MYLRIFLARNPQAFQGSQGTQTVSIAYTWVWMKIAAIISWAHASTFYMHLFHLMLPIPYYLHFRNKEIVAQRSTWLTQSKSQRRNQGSKAQIFGTPKSYSLFLKLGDWRGPKCWGRGEQMDSWGGNKKGLGSWRVMGRSICLIILPWASPANQPRLRWPS